MTSNSWIDQVTVIDSDSVGYPRVRIRFLRKGGSIALPGPGNVRKDKGRVGEPVRG